MKSIYSEINILSELRHYLPTQTPLKDFIHHNILHAFQKDKFYNAIFKASKIFGFQVTMQLDDYRKLYEIKRIKSEIVERIIIEKKGKECLQIWNEFLLLKKYDEHNEKKIGILRSHWKNQYHIDLDNLVQPFLFRMLGSYLDQGVSIWRFPIGNLGFLEAIKELEQNGIVSIFKSKKAKKLLFTDNLSITSLLKLVVENESYFDQYLFDQQFSHRGWSGMVATLEEKPESLLSPKKISLNDLIIFELLLEIDHLEYRFGKKWQPICKTYADGPLDLFSEIENTELHEVLKIWQDSFEWSYYDQVLAGIRQLNFNKKNIKIPENKSFQAVFCIDERECSIRRHLENGDRQCETFGTPGFFGVEFFFQAQGAKFYDKLCPAPVTPKYLIKEFNVSEKRKHDLLYSAKTHEFITGFLSAFSFGFWAGFRMVQNIFSPKMSPAISDAFSHMNMLGELTIENKDINHKENGLQIGFTIEEMIVRVSSLLNSIALTKNFAPVIYLVSHGSSSANNPHHGAHDCGACSGRPGSVNSRVFAFMANHKEVRNSLKLQGIEIPNDSQFVGALHDTAADEIEYYDLDILSLSNKLVHLKNVYVFENALDLNAKERSRRFASINTKQDIKNIRLAIKKRSVSLFEPRPELGHGTNTLCIVGKRNLTKGLFLDRRSFLNSYDYKTDPEGTFLTSIMRPLGPVCGGINLEYYFSRVDNYKLGAGTKLPHNVTGLIGVTNSSDGDLRAGLPWQMVEIHDPLRLLIIVEHFPDVVLKTVKSDLLIYEWFINEWIHLVVINPETNDLSYFKDGEFIKYFTLAKEIQSFKDVNSLLEEAKKMETNQIDHATQENFPVYMYN